MTSTIGIILNVLLDIALLGLLAFVMSRAAKLTPHRPRVREPALSAFAHAAAPQHHVPDGDEDQNGEGNDEAEDRPGQKVSGDRDGDL